MTDHAAAINAALSNALKDPEEWFEYCYALSDAAAKLGNEALSKEEHLLVAANQLDVCINSSGLYSYFEMQPDCAALGKQAMDFLGLPDLSRMITQAGDAIGISPNPTSEQIAKACRKWSVQPSERFAEMLEKFASLEEFYYADQHAIMSAVVTYVQTHHQTLGRPPQ